MSSGRRGGGVLALTFLAGFALAILPLPAWARPFRPEWCAMVLVYWCMALPERCGVLLGWFVGLGLDVLTGTLLGQHALGLAALAYLVLKIHRSTRVKPLWQQALTVLPLLLTYRMLGLWVLGVVGTLPDMRLYWAPSLVSMLLWPWMFSILRATRRRFNVA